MTKQMLEQTTQQNGSSPSPRPLTTPNSPTDRLTGFRNTREEPGQPDIPEDDRWLVGYRLNRMNSTVLLGGFNPALTAVLRSKRFATLVRDEGWVIPIRYLAHVERLLAGADVDLFDVDGAPTPGQRERERADDRNEAQRVLADIRAAREAAADAVRVEHARREARAAFDRAIADRHPDHETEDRMTEPVDHTRTATPVAG